MTRRFIVQADRPGPSVKAANTPVVELSDVEDFDFLDPRPNAEELLIEAERLTEVARVVRESSDHARATAKRTRMKRLAAERRERKAS